jgi:LPS-assembly lipoprotein
MLAPRLSIPLLALGLAPLAGCNGFTPLYAQPVVSKMSAIEVARPDGRTGFLLGQYLDDDLAKDRGQPALYRLQLKITEVRIPRGQQINNVASRYEVDLSTVYTLVEIATRRPIATGVVKVNVGYDSAAQPYAGIAAEQDGERRAAETTADRLRLELAAYFASPRPSPPPSALIAASSETYSDRLQPSQVLSPRERALGEPTSQSGGADLFGRPVQTTDSPANPAAAPFSPSTDPAVEPPAEAPRTPAQESPPPADPTAIKTLPLDPGPQ